MGMVVPIDEWLSGGWPGVDSGTSRIRLLPDYANEVLADSPAAYYRLDETSGTTVADSSGNGHTLTANAAIGGGAGGLLRADADRAIPFDWTANAPKYASSAYSIGQDGMTVEFWVKPASFASSGTVSVIVACGNLTGWAAYYDATGGWFFVKQNVLAYAFGSNAGIGTTQHVAFVVSSNGVSVSQYINGVFIATNSSGGSMLATTDGLQIANNGGGVTHNPNATIDEVAIYPTELSAARIAAHYKAGTAPAAAGLEAIADSGTSTFGIASSGTEAIKDAGTSLVGLLPNVRELDNFNNGALQALSGRAGWHPLHIWTGDVDFLTDSGPTKATNNSVNADNAWGTQFSPDQEITLTLQDVFDFDMYVRLNRVAQPATYPDQGYAMNFSGGSAWKLYDVLFTGVIASGTQTVSAGDQIRWRVIGSTLTAWYRAVGAARWALIIEATDGRYTQDGWIGFDGVVAGVVSFDSISGGVPTPLAGEAISDSGVGTFGFASSGAEALSDVATSTVVIAPTGTEAIADAATSLVVITPVQAAYGYADAGTSNVIVAPAGAAEALADAATGAFVLASSGGEAIADAATSLVVIVPVQAAFGYVDAGTSIVVIAPTGGEAVGDAATSTVTLTPTGTEAIADAATSTVILTPSGGEALRDAGTSTVVIAPTGGEAIADGGTAAWTILSTGSENVIVFGLDFVTIISSGVEAIRDAGTSTFTIAPSAAVEAIVEPIATSLVVITPSTIVEGYADAGTSTITLTRPVVAFHATPLRDTFNAGANQNVDARAGWRSTGSYPQFWPTMVTDAVPTFAYGYIAANAWDEPYADPEVWAPLGAWPAVNDLRLYARWDEVAQTGYLLQVYNVNATNWQFQLLRVDPAGWVNLGGVTVGTGGFGGAALTAGDEAGISAVGARISIYVRQAGVVTLLATVKDSTYVRSGDIGMGTEDHVLTFDAFGGGEAVSSAFQGIADAGTSTVTLTPIGTEALRDAGSDAFTISSAGSSSSSDAGTSTVTLTPTGTEAISDAGSDAWVISSTGNGSVVAIATFELLITTLLTREDSTVVSVSRDATSITISADATAAVLQRDATTGRRERDEQVSVH